MKNKLSILLFLFVPAANCQANSTFQNSLWGHAASLAGVSPSTLYAIAAQETGMRWQDGTFRPWPWTLNINENDRGIKAGARRYPDQQSAVLALNQFVRSGLNNIDVGLMQINLRWHGNKAASPASLLDPRINILIAARILKDNAKISPTRQDVIGRYHSATPARGKAYSNRVFHYARLIDHVGK